MYLLCASVSQNIIHIYARAVEKGQETLDKKIGIIKV